MSLYIPSSNSSGITQAQLTAATNQCVKTTQLTKAGLANGVTQLDTRGCLTLSESVSYSSHYDVKSAAVGAVGDGVTDDAPAINAFISSHSSGNFTLYFPPATYILSYAIGLANCNNVILQGEGPQTILKASGSSDIIDMRLVNHCLVRDMVIDGNSTAGPCILLAGQTGGSTSFNSFINLRIQNSTNTQAGILLDGQSNALDSTLVQNCEFDNIGGVGVSQNCVIRTRIEGCRFNGSGYEAITCDHQTDYCIIVGNTITGVTGGVGGIGLDNCRWCTITGNTISNMGLPGICFPNNYLSTQLFNTPYNSLNNTITGNTISYCNTGIKLNVNSVANNTICDRTVITGNTLWSNVVGIDVQSGCLRTVVCGNSDADSGNMVWSNLDISNVRDTVFQFGTGALKADTITTGTGGLNLNGEVYTGRVSVVSLNGGNINPIYGDTTTNFLTTIGASGVPTCLAVVCNNKCTGYITVDSSSPDNLNIGLDGTGNICFRTGMNISDPNIGTSGVVQMQITNSSGINCNTSFNVNGDTSQLLLKGTTTAGIACYSTGINTFDSTFNAPLYMRSQTPSNAVNYCAILDTTSASSGAGQGLLLRNTSGGAGATMSIDFMTFANQALPPARIQAMDTGGAACHLIFSTRDDNSNTTAAVERLRLTQTGNLLQSGSGYIESGTGGITCNGSLVMGSNNLTVTSGTLTLPNATDTLVGKATTDTLTNKTLTSPVISGGSINSSVIGATAAAAGTFTTLSSGTITSASTGNNITFTSSGGKTLDLTALGISSPYLDKFANFHFPNAVANNLWSIVDKSGNSALQVYVDGTQHVNIGGDVTQTGSSSISSGSNGIVCNGPLTVTGSLNHINGISTVGNSVPILVSSIYATGLTQGSVPLIICQYNVPATGGPYTVCLKGSCCVTQSGTGTLYPFNAQYTSPSGAVAFALPGSSSATQGSPTTTMTSGGQFNLFDTTVLCAAGTSVAIVATGNAMGGTWAWSQSAFMYLC